MLWIAAEIAYMLGSLTPHVWGLDWDKVLDSPGPDPPSGDWTSRWENNLLLSAIQISKLTHWLKEIHTEGDSWKKITEMELYTSNDKILCYVLGLSQ